MKHQPDQPDQPDQATAETLDHLQTAASEMIAAARSFLDAVEGVVHDRDAVASVVETFTTVAQAAAQAASRVNPTRRPSTANSTGNSSGGVGRDEDDPPGVQHIRVS